MFVKKKHSNVCDNITKQDTDYRRTEYLNLNKNLILSLYNKQNPFFFVFFLEALVDGPPVVQNSGRLCLDATRMEGRGCRQEETLLCDVLLQEVA